MVLVSCKICGKQINRKPSALRNKSGFPFCSRNCAGKYGTTLTLPKRFTRNLSKPQVVDETKVHWVDKYHRPVNPIAKDAWDRRVNAGEIREC
jgi:ribosome-binding protein aMBF1 (putative translation factor)